MSRAPEPQPLLVQLGDLLLVELTNWRWSWRMMLLLGMVTPLGTLAALKILLREPRPVDLAYALAGNVVLSLMFENQNRVGGHFVYMRDHGTLDYFGSLPVRRPVVVLAVVGAFLLLSLPAVVVIVLGGSLLMGIDLQVSPLVLLVVPVCALSLAGIGAVVGLAARNSQEATSLGLLVTIVLAGLGAVMVPPDRLPGWLVALGRLSPATHAGSAFRQVLFGPVTAALAVDLAILALFAIGTTWLAGRQLDWRRR